MKIITTNGTQIEVESEAELRSVLNLTDLVSTPNSKHSTLLYARKDLWKPADEEAIVKLRSQGKTFEDIALLLKRTTAAVRWRYYQKVNRRR